MAGGNNRSGPDTEWDGTPQEFERWDGQMVTLDPAYVLLDAHRMPFEGDAAAGQTTYASACATCHGNAGEGGIGPALTDREFARMSRQQLDAAAADSSHPGATAYNALSVEAKTDLLARLRGFSGVPGYYLTAAAGSAGDVVTQSNVEVESIDDSSHGRYRLLMIRALTTGNADDAQFVAGSEYPFGVALMDDDGRNHIGSMKEMLALDP